MIKIDNTNRLIYSYIHVHLPCPQGALRPQEDSRHTAKGLEMDQSKTEISKTERGMLRGYST